MFAHIIHYFQVKQIEAHKSGDDDAYWLAWQGELATIEAQDEAFPDCVIH